MSNDGAKQISSGREFPTLDVHIGKNLLPLPFKKNNLGNWDEVNWATMEGTKLEGKWKKTKRGLEQIRSEAGSGGRALEKGAGYPRHSVHR